MSTSCEMPGWMKHNLESRLPGEITITTDMQMTPPLWQKASTKEPLDESKKGEWKSWLKTQHSENHDAEIMASSPITLWEIDGEIMETVSDFTFPIWNQSVSPCPVLTVASWPACRFLIRWVKWSGILISLRIFQFAVIHTVKGFGIVNKAEIDVILERSCFFDDLADVGNLISGSCLF